MAHFYLIHALSVLLGLCQGFRLHEMLNIFLFYAKGHGLPPAGVYVFWTVLLAILYPFWRRVARVKARRQDGWLSYLQDPSRAGSGQKGRAAHRAPRGRRGPTAGSG